MPNNPMMLLSFINTQLRDNYDSLDELCASYMTEQDEIKGKLETIGYIYDASLNKFIPQ